MTRTTDKDARSLEQLARGRRTRYCWNKWIQIAEDRVADDAESAVVADVIRTQTVAVPIGVAPCAGKIVRCSINATQWVEIATGGTVTARFYKATIGASNTALDTGTTTISWVTAGTSLTADTVRDATMSATAATVSVLEGQLIYVDIAASNHAIAAKSLGLMVMVEFVPTDQRD